MTVENTIKCMCRVVNVTVENDVGILFGLKVKDLLEEWRKLPM
jgi:hypothetical protein